MTDDQQSRGGRPLAAELTDAERRREEVAETLRAGRAKEAADTLLFSAWLGAAVTLVGTFLIAGGLKSWGDDLTEGFVENSSLALLWFGGVTCLVGVLFLVRAVVGWAVQTGMDASGR